MVSAGSNKVNLIYEDFNVLPQPCTGLKNLTVVVEQTYL